MEINEAKTIVYTAQSKHLFYARMLICRFVLERGAVPLNPFNLWGYFLYELVDHDLVRRGNNNVVRIVDEVWVFGPVADGVLAEIDLAIGLNKPLRFFSAGSRYEDMRPIGVADVEFEETVSSKSNLKAIRDWIALHQRRRRVIMARR